MKRLKYTAAEVRRAMMAVYHREGGYYATDLETRVIRQLQKAHKTAQSPSL